MIQGGDFSEGRAKSCIPNKSIHQFVKNLIIAFSCEYHVTEWCEYCVLSASMLKRCYRSRLCEKVKEYDVLFSLYNLF